MDNSTCNEIMQKTQYINMLQSEIIFEQSKMIEKLSSNDYVCKHDRDNYYNLLKNITEKLVKIQEGLIQINENNTDSLEELFEITNKLESDISTILHQKTIYGFYSNIIEGV
jgi:hypothetical protein